MCGLFERSNNDGKSQIKADLFISLGTRKLAVTCELPSASLDSTWH